MRPVYKPLPHLHGEFFAGLPWRNRYFQCRQSPSSAWAAWMTTFNAGKQIYKSGIATQIRDLNTGVSGQSNGYKRSICLGQSQADRIHTRQNSAKIDLLARHLGGLLRFANAICGFWIAFRLLGAGRGLFVDLYTESTAGLAATCKVIIAAASSATTIIEIRFRFIIFSFKLGSRKTR